MRIIYKYQEGNKAKRVDFVKWYELEKKKQGKNVRPLNLEALRQLEDSLISRNFGLAQRLAILATAQQEMGKEGPASKGKGGNSLIQELFKISSISGLLSLSTNILLIK